MLFESEGKIYLKVEDKYVEVKITKSITGGEFNVVPTKNKIEVEHAPKMFSITVEEAYKKNNKKDNLS